jgi:hypothetical protein
VVDLNLRSKAIKSQEAATVKVRTIELPIQGNSEKNHASFKLVQSWVDHVSQIHAQKKSTSLNGMQTKDFELLMAEWPEELDEAISNEKVY